MAALSIGVGCAHEPVRSRADAIRALERIAIVITDDGEFTVVDERRRPLEGALAFGLTGLAVAAGDSALDSGTDRKTTEALASTLDGPSCRERFQAALEKTLRASARIDATLLPDVEQARRAGLDAIAIFALDSCGFQRLEGGAMVAFIELSGRLETPVGAALWDDRQTVVAITHLSAEELLSEPTGGRRAFEQVLDDAGRRMANELLYPRGGDG